MNRLVKEVDTLFCQYQPKDPTFEDLFNTTVEDFETDVPCELSVIVDEYGMLEHVAEKHGFTENYMAYHLDNRIQELGKALKILKIENQKLETLFDNVVRELLEARLNVWDLEMEEERKEEVIKEIKSNFIKELQNE